MVRHHASSRPGLAALTLPGRRGGGVADLIAAEGHAARGALCRLTPAQAARLDAYERGYTRTPVRVTTDAGADWCFLMHAAPCVSRPALLSAGADVDAIAYLMTPPAAFEAPPSEAYLCAIRRNLAESGGGAEAAIPLLRASTAAERAAGRGATVELGAPWMRPARVTTLRAACYEAGAAARPPWELPARAAQAEAALHAAGVADVGALCEWLRRAAPLSSLHASSSSVPAHAGVSPLRAALAAVGHADALDAAAEAALAAALLSAEDESAAAAAPAESA